MSSPAPTSVSRAPGAVHIRGYRLERVVGSGGMGQVYRAEQASLNRPVAVKVLSAELAKDQSFVSRFEKEAAALATLQHPHIVTIVDRGETTDGVPYLVMEFIEGPSLREVMRSPLFDARAGLRIFGEVARAIDYAHRRNVIHRDLKPENILLDEQAGGIAKVGDFGLAAFMADEPTRFNLTQTHMAMGTLAYMAPEQRLDAKTADGRADIYSLGVLLYELLTGSTPMGTFEPPSRLRAGLDPRLDGVVFRCLRPDPNDRFASVSDLLEELEPLLPQGAPEEPPVSPATSRFLRKVKRGLLALVTSAGTLVVAVAIAVLFLTWPRLTGKAEPAPAPAEVLGGTELGSARAMSAQGRMDQSGRAREARLLSPGPDNMPLLVSGREVVQEERALVFPLSEDATRAGRAVLDTMEGPAESVVIRAVAQATGPTDDTLGDRVMLVLRGPRRPAHAAVLLMGDPGRYVALLVAEDSREATITWALGQRRGEMRAPIGTSVQTAQQLELSIDAEGNVQAYLGEGKNRRAVGEPLALGGEWIRMFGRLPQPAVGCLEGRCTFNDTSFTVRRPAPPPPPPPAPEPRVERPAAVKPKPKPVPRPTQRKAPARRR